MIPSTKAKQREFVDVLIDGVANNTMGSSTLLKHLRVLRRQLRNRKPVRKSPAAAQTVTAAVRAQVKAMVRRNPTLTNQHIADRLNLNAGRVSEILAGKRR